MLGSGQVAGLEILAELAEEGGDRILLAGGLAGFAAAVMTMMVAVRAAKLSAGLLQILLDVGEIGLRGRKVARFQILGELRNGGAQRVGGLRAGSRREQRALLSSGKQLLKRREIALRLGEISRKQILAELLKALLELLLVRTGRGCGSNLAENTAGNSKDTHGCFLFSRPA